MDSKELDMAAEVAAEWLFERLREYDSGLELGEGTPSFRIIDIPRLLEPAVPDFTMDVLGASMVFILPGAVNISFERGFIRIGPHCLRVDSLERALSDLTFISSLAPQTFDEYLSAEQCIKLKRREDNLIGRIMMTSTENALMPVLASAGLEASFHHLQDSVEVTIAKKNGKAKCFLVRNDSFAQDLDAVQKWVEKYLTFLPMVPER